MSRGCFITLEGGEGCGKTTNIDFLKQYLESQGKAVVVTREPGGTPLAESIRQLLLHVEDEPVAVDTELLLMFAARAQHVAQLIKPALVAGKWVICSRFTDSTYAYQGGGRGIEWQRISDLEQYVLGDFRPDATILLDVSVDVGMQRARNRADLDRIEKEDLAFFERVRQTFLRLASESPVRYHVINAEQPLQTVQQQLVSVMNTL